MIKWKLIGKLRELSSLFVEYNQIFYLHIGRTMIPNQSSVEFGLAARKCQCSVVFHVNQQLTFIPLH